MTKKIFCTFCLFCMMFIETSYAQDDDSTPYMPYSIPQQIGTGQDSQQNTQTPPSRQAPAKKSASKKKTASAKKKTSSSAQRTAPKMSSLQQGIALMQQNKYEAARPYLLKAIQEERNNPNAWYWYGVYHEKTGGYHQAQYFYSKAVTIDPAFEPLSRVVFQPNDSDKTPLWDPKRPARVYEIPTSNTGGIGAVTPNSLGLSDFPTAPNDPELPKVPVYTPPDPGTSPLNGDSWNAGIYVPPSHNELGINEGNSAVYIPPSSQGIIATDSVTYRQVAEIPIYSQPDNSAVRASSAQDDRIIRADLPLYTPPTPEQQASRQPQSVQTSTRASTASTSERKTASVPSSRVVKQNTAKKKTTTAKPAVTAPATQKAAPTKTRTRTVSRDTRPATPRTTTTAPSTAQPAQPTTAPTRTAPTQQTQQRQPETSRTVEPETASRSSEYMPPVGQYSPDPGTISETPIPPVGQGSQD